MGFSLMQGNSWPTSLWHGCLAGYFAALLLRWWGRAWRKGLTQSLQEREEAENAIMPAITTPKVSKT